MVVVVCCCCPPPPIPPRTKKTAIPPAAAIAAATITITNVFLFFITAPFTFSLFFVVRLIDCHVRCLLFLSPFSVSPTGTIALASIIEGGITLLFPSAEAAKKIFTCDGLTATIVGKEHKDKVIQGTERDDVIVGRGGNDLIFGNGGDDHICGGAGSDHLEGNNCNDRLFGGDGNGNPGNDNLFGEEGNDNLFGGDGNDQLNGDNGNDFLDSKDGVLGNEMLHGGPHVTGDQCDSDPDPEVNCEFGNDG